MNLNYHTSTCIHLHLEDFYNAGLTPEKAKETIESLRDYDGNYLYCEPSGINQNWTVNTCKKDANLIANLVFEINGALERVMA